MSAYVAAPVGAGPFPGVIIFHDAFGLNAHIRSVADQLAKEGCLAVIPELFHRTAPEGFEARYYQVPLTQSHVNALADEHTDIAMRAVHKWLSNQENVKPGNLGALGFSFGGRLAFIASDILQLQAAACICPLSLDKEVERIPKMKGAHLMVWAGRDENVPRGHMSAVAEAMHRAGAKYTNVEISDAAHGFSFPGHPAYHAAAAAEAWAMTREFLKARLA